MKTDKVTLTIKAEGLAKEVFRGLILHMLENMENGVESGSLRMDDGDSIEWDIARKKVEF